MDGEQAYPAELLARARDMRVLVAEDHPTNRRLVQMMLEPFGFQQTFAENGLEAIREIRARETAAGRGRTAIAVVSANVGPEHEAAARDAGADLHIPKPLSLRSLLGGMAAALAAAEARHA